MRGYIHACLIFWVLAALTIGSALGAKPATPASAWIITICAAVYTIATVGDLKWGGR